jgi:predicted hydrocarbon binding protein
MNQILDSISFDPNEGKLTLQALRYLLVRPGLLLELQKALEMHLPDEAAGILSDAAQNEGVVLASRLKEVFSYSEEQVLSSLAFMLAEAGWGATTVQMVNLENCELVFKVEASPFAEEYGPSVGPVCHLLLGLFRGAGLVLFERDIDGQEVQCIAKGGTSCMFVVSAKPA